DDSSRRTWLRQNGARQSFARLFEGPNETIMAGGDSIGLSIREPYGWYTILDDPGTDNFVYGVTSAVADNSGAIWVIHQWSGFLPSGANLLRVSPEGTPEPYSSYIPGEVQDVCLTTFGDACVVTSDGIHIFDSSSFIFLEISELGADAEILNSFGDISGNIWLCASTGGANILIKYALGSGETTVFDETTPGLLYPMVTDMTCDSKGNVWFAMMDGVCRFDGNNFTSIPTVFHVTSIDAGPDDIIYCGSNGAGLYRIENGEIHGYSVGNSSLRKGEYSFAVGLADGGFILADPSTHQPFEGYEQFDGRFWQAVGADGELPVKVKGVFEGAHLWAWGDSDVYLKNGDEWVDVTDDALADAGVIQGVYGGGNGPLFLLTNQTLFYFGDSGWLQVEAPEPQSTDGYAGLMIDKTGIIYIFDKGLGLEVCDLAGNWSRLDESNVLPGPPTAVNLADNGVVNVCGYDSEDGEYMLEIDGPLNTIHSFAEHNQPAQEVTAITYDLAGRVWMLGSAPDNSAKAVIFDPVDASWRGIDEALGVLPQNSNDNRALQNCMFDRSFSEYGTLWWAGSGGPKRVNFAPQSRVITNTDLYGVLDNVKVEVQFSNYAGSIAVDWYSALEDVSGGRIYWLPNLETGESFWTAEETPAIANLTVPTDVSMMIQFEPITIPADFTDGHYRWRSGFKKAGGEEWLGTGFPSYAEFCIVKPPTP
ncbi:MAG: hypothetical protein JW941_03875, partial [Candidatus Coatesbacteria bacterium]|nr:hypothetical protein [Candidatus Coatesbacteria bacterium]